jgi:hypothetical protein
VAPAGDRRPGVVDALDVAEAMELSSVAASNANER